MKRVITFGTFDLFHIGHLNILERAAKLGNHLSVGVSTDALSLSKKKVQPFYKEEERVRIVQSIRFVDEVFLEESLEKKKDYILRHRADILVMGDDWQGKFDHLSDICKVVYLPRTKHISTSDLINTIKDLD